MTKEFSLFIRRRIRFEILWKAFQIVLFLSPLIFFWLISRRNPIASNMFLYMACAVVLFVLFITIPRWRRHFLAQYYYASKFAETLEIKTKELTSALNHLKQTALPKEIFWINFKIDPATLKIKFQTRPTKEELPSNFEDIRNRVESLISAKESTISELRKKGWSADDKIELFLEMIIIWISSSWNRVQLQNLKIRSTISIKGRSGYYNMISNKWEEKSFFS